MMKNRAAGFYLTLVSAVLALVGLILYTRVMYKTTIVFVFLIAAIVVEAAGLALNKRLLNDWLPLIGAVLLGAAGAMSASVMVNQIGYVIAGLDKMNTIVSFIVFVVIAVLGMLVDLVAGFLKQTKDE